MIPWPSEPSAVYCSGSTVAMAREVEPEVEADLRRRLARPVRQHRHLDEDHLDACGPCALDQAGEPRDHRRVHRDVDAEPVERPAGRAEIALHVDDEERGVRRVDELLELGEDLLALDLDHSAAIRLRRYITRDAEQCVEA